MKVTRYVACFLFALLGVSPLFSGPASADCYDDEDICIERARDASDRCSDSCDRRYGNNFDAWDRCTTRCDDAEDSATNACERRADQCRASDVEAPADVMHGSRDSGGDGCYFGECPDSSAPQTTPRPQQTGTNDWPSGRNNPPAPPPSQNTSICQTPTFWCAMGVRGPVGAPCYCNSPMGFANGVTVPEQ